MIPFRLIKGQKLQKKYYPTNFYRQSHDVDLLIRKKDREKVFALLDSAGYQMLDKEGRIVPTFESTLGTHIEVVFRDPLYKLEIDLHWYLYPEFILIDVPVSHFFPSGYSKEEDYFLDACELLIHHGSREGWLKLKYIFDWYFLIQNPPGGFQWQHYYTRLKEYKLFKTFCSANTLCHTFIKPNSLPQRVVGELRKTIELLDLGRDLIRENKPVSRIRHEQILWGETQNPSIMKKVKGIYKFQASRTNIEYSKSQRRSRIGIFNVIKKVIYFLLH